MFQFFQNSKFKLHILCETSLRDPTIEGREGGRGVPNPSSSLNLTQIPVPSLTVVQIPVTKSKIPNLIPVLMQSFPSSQCSHSHFPSAVIPIFPVQKKQKSQYSFYPFTTLTIASTAKLALGLSLLLLE